MQGSKIVLVRSYLRVSQAAGQVNILIFLLKIKFSPCMPINLVMQGKCLFSDISRPDVSPAKHGRHIGITTPSASYGGQTFGSPFLLRFWLNCGF